MIENALIFILGGAFCFALVAGWLGKGIVTPPMVAIGLGTVFAVTLGTQAADLENSLHLIAEITLVIVLFSDAAMIKSRSLSGNLGIPMRMLLIGLPLAIAFGVLLNMYLLPGWPVWEMVLLAAILAPTDAALGQAVVTNPAVPERLRTALIIESGVNDGLALPAVLFFGCLAVGGLHDSVQTSWAVFAAKQIGLGTIIGVTIGAGGGWLMTHAARRGLTQESFEGIGVLALAGLSYLSALQFGGNGFLAAFSGGLAFGFTFDKSCKFVLEFLETEGQLLVLGTFLLLGVVVAPQLVHGLTPAWIALILLSLFVTRPLAIWLSLVGTSTTPGERLFLGWFGPRGLATALFALLVLQEFEALRMGHEILLLCFLAVMISAVCHGISASPIANRFTVKA